MIIIGVRIKRIILNTYNTINDEGLVLCMSRGKYYINYFGGVEGTETLIDDIQSIEEAKEKFLELVWNMS